MSTIDDLTRQRAGVEDRRAAFQQAVVEAQAMIDQDGATVEDQIQARMRLGAACGALASTEGQIRQIDDQIATAQAQAAREAAIERIIAQAAAGQQAFVTYEAARQATNEALQRLIPEIATALAAVRDARAGFIAEARQLAPGLVKVFYSATVSEDVVQRERAQLADLLTELERRGVDRTVVSAIWRPGEYTVIDTSTLLSPPLEPYEGAVQLALATYEKIPSAGALAIAESNATKLDRTRLSKLLTHGKPA